MSDKRTGKKTKRAADLAPVAATEGSPTVSQLVRKSAGKKKPK